MDVTQRLESLTTKIDKAKSRKARAELENEQASARLDKNKTLLKTSFKVDTLEDAEALKVKLEKIIEKKISDAEAALEDQ